MSLGPLRVSNIFDSEYSRVKLDPDPIWPDSTRTRLPGSGRTRPVPDYPGLAGLDPSLAGLYPCPTTRVWPDSTRARLPESSRTLPESGRIRPVPDYPSLAGLYPSLAGHPPVPTNRLHPDFAEMVQIVTSIKEVNSGIIRLNLKKRYVVQGSNGEYVLLNPDERIKLVKHVFQMTPSDKLIIAGSGCESPRETILLTNKMADAGAQAVLIVTPHYYKGRMTSEALTKYYTKVADESKVPVILYSVPANTSIDLDPEVIVKLSQHPNIVGVKDSGGDISKIGSLVHRTSKNNFQVLSGSASFLLPAYVVGCVGGICALSNVLGQEVCQLESLFKKGKMAEAKLLQHRLIAPNMAVTKRFGVAGLKKSMDWLGMYGGPTRSPLLPLSAEEEQSLRSVFRDNGFL
ncbi:4-hydroxy-2-oxoglutarate aldolase, mitochondrial-like [Gigantopelta aegis]|uniref:4-hydroxy-2-oxoglutarate aldolase, mitochondrial-like n=1 Tax=Gigantopelta aegis TaxID=1735272 RepID=UPI001B88D225|nr:4-hydroxy-2-oxoglutarate aldolase, mitochondrial-like [Gigantopelta aegis]